MDEEISLSVEETNALRLKLGLKPLKIVAKEESTNQIPKAVEKQEEKNEQIDADEWLSKMSKMSAEPKKDNLFKSIRPLDYKIGHDFDDIQSGQHIFTLKDTNDPEVVLESRNILEATKGNAAKLFVTSDMTSEQPGLYESEIDNKGFLLSDPKPKKRKLAEYLGPKVSLSVTPTIIAPQGRVRTFKKFKKSKRNLREAEDEKIEIIPTIPVVKKIDIEDIVAASRPYPPNTNEVKFATKIPFIEETEENIEDLIRDTSALDNSTAMDKMEIDKVEVLEETLEEGEVEKKPINDSKRVTFKETPTTNFFNLPSFSVAPFLPKIAAIVDLYEISLKIKNIDTEIFTIKEAQKKTRNKTDVRKMDDELKRLEQQRFKLVDQKTANYKPKVNLEYKQGGKTLTPKEAFKALGGKPKKHSK